MTNRVLALSLILGLFAAAPLAGEAQPAKVARVGVLLFGTPETDAFFSIRRGLSGLGYVEDRTSSSSIATRKESPSGSPTWRTTSSVRSPT